MAGYGGGAQAGAGGMEENELVSGSGETMRSIFKGRTR
jgi:hypothetical protein